MNARAEVSPEVGRTIVVRGIKTNYHDIGTGDPVVLLHGSGPGVSAWANWRLTIPAIARTHRVIAVDMLGFGYTDPDPAGVYDVASWQDHLLGFLDALDLREVSLVGNSFGGGMALKLAISQPRRVDKMVLMGSSGLEFEMTEGLRAVWGYQPSVANMKALMQVFAFDPGLVSDDLAEMRHRASTRPGVAEAFAQMFNRPWPQNRIPDLSNDPELLKRLPHDTLIVHGREDRVVPLESSIRMSGLLDRSQLHVFGRCGHWTQIEHATRFNRLVSGFLEG